MGIQVDGLTDVRTYTDALETAWYTVPGMDTAAYTAVDAVGTPSFTAVNANTSVISYDTAATVASGGVDIANLELGKTDSSGPLNLADLNIELGPGDTLTISAESAGANDAAATLTWQELF
tara:strand:- start:1292 stop:1654 length:363 start_codon:yes stop_codon:yes gene_type:complete